MNFLNKKAKILPPPGADVVLKPTDVEGAVDKEDCDDLLKWANFQILMCIKKNLEFLK